ncbi:MAG: hypothetical protein INR62_02385 [Rhodospirillales bacterium]|nr:hypothetical protein [Acetobacter sp.]
MLEATLGQIPFVKLKSVRAFDPVFKVEPDLQLDLEAGDRPWVIVVEAKRRGFPREASAGVAQLRHFLDQIPKKGCYGVLAAPFISEKTARFCEESGVGYVDLAGNAFLSFDQIYIRTRAAENPRREKRGLRSVFSAKAGRVLRVLLTPPLRAWKVTGLAEAAGVSVGQISNVRKLLRDHEWATVEEGGIRIREPEALLRAWRGCYQPRQEARQAAYTLLHGDALEEAVRAAQAEASAGAHAVLATYSAARWLAPYARQATLFFYTDGVGEEILRRHLKLRPVGRGENVMLLRPREDDVFSGRISPAPGVWCTGLVQTWLDLATAGERGEEAAEHLLRSELLPAWEETSK